MSGTGEAATFSYDDNVGENADPPSQTSDPTRFVGNPQDPDTGLGDFGAREYSSHEGRFTGVDP